jgi:formiminotetrahydrofolate cyclodeaminase
MEYGSEKIGTFLEELSSKAAVPGGGGVSALTGALAAGLAQMVCGLTIGKKRYIEVEQELTEVSARLEQLRETLVSCMAEDAQAFEPLSKAYGLPKDTPEQLQDRERVMEECLVQAAAPPMKICETVAQLLPLIKTVASKGSRLAVSDAGCAAVLAIAALKAAALNVTVNTRLMKNRETAGQLDAQVDALLAEVPGQLELIYTQINADLRGL